MRAVTPGAVRGRREAAEDGHNALADLYFHPSCSLFEQEVSPKLKWVFPPDDLIDLVVTFLYNLIRTRTPLRVALLVPERSSTAMGSSLYPALCSDAGTSRHSAVW